VDVRAAAGRAQSGPHHEGAERCGDPVPVGCRPRAQPAPQRPGVDAVHGPGDPRQPALHRPPGVEPAAHQSRADRPGQHRAGSPAGPALALPEGWVISDRPSHPALVSEEDFIAVQGIRAERDTGTAAGRRYLLAGLLRCGTCGRRLESCWANNRPAYRCRHGHSSATTPDQARPKNVYVREDRILPHLPALHTLLTRGEAPAGRIRRRTRRGVEVSHAVTGEHVIAYLRDREITLTYDPQTRSLRADTSCAATTVIGRAS